MAVLVGDGAGAVVLEPVEGPGNLLSWNLNADGSLRHLLKCDHGGYLYMDGKEIFRKAVRVVVDSAERALADAGLAPDDIALLVPHQANLRIIQAACQRLGIPEERTAVVIDRYGNTSSASIPLALDDAVEHGRVHDGDHLLLTGFGGGHDMGQRRPPLGRLDDVTPASTRARPGRPGRRPGPPLRGVQTPGARRTERRSGHRPAGK